ncbi:hypothetical protein [Xenorhabdus japonica]|uniref:Uncharacterized protein n=1 Tax=Xenorhabdus japonica TaxID=53341 RepID=A0A1I5AXN7_9GAMM|nr:hypothetical protein [Xenorhabdus japonica]SFN67214.1 hypothetical protein SAMN05421579_11474 [Xenorhabdus japonica]
MTEKHIKLWFKEGVIGRYLLLDDMRAIWFKRGLESVFDLLFHEVKSYKYLAVRTNDADWATIVQSGIDLKTGEVNVKKRGRKIKDRVYITYALNRASDLYTDSAHKMANKNQNSTPNNNHDREYSTVEALPSPEPVIPHFELEKIYSLIHNIPLLENYTEIKTKEKEINGNPRSLNFMARLVKALLHIQYSADEAENIRRELDDPHSRISTDFSDKGIKAPSGKALHGKLRDMLIEIVPLIENVDIEKLDIK